MQKEEQVIPQGVRLLYSAPMPDTSNITASVDGCVVTITYAGGAIYIPIEALPTVTALTATVSAAIEPLTPIDETVPVEPEPEPQPAEPEPEPEPADLPLFEDDEYDLEVTTPMENPYIQE